MKCRSILCIPLAGTVLLTTGCDEQLNLLDARFSYLHNPRSFYTVINSLDPSQGKIVRVEFNHFGTNFKIYQSTRQVPGPRVQGLLPRGGGLAFPDPDEHFFDPWDWPDPEDDIPLPDPPDFLPDPDDDIPLPDPPPFPDDFDMGNLSDGTVTSVDLGGEQLGYANAPEVARPKATIRLGAQPAGLATTPDRSILLVAMMGESRVAIIQQSAVVGSIPLPAGTRPFAITMTRDGTRAYVTNFTNIDASVLTLDVPNRRVLNTVSVGNFPAGVALTPDETQFWVSSKFEDTITIFDTLTNTPVTRITGILNGWGIAFNPFGTRAYVAGASDVAGSLFVIDTSSYQIVATIPVGDGPRNVAVSQTGRHVFVVNHRSNFISQIDARTNKLVRNIVVGKDPAGFRFAR